MITLLLAIIGFIALPLIIIWALNTLFPLKIAYSFKTWLAVIALLVIVFGKWPIPFHRNWPFGRHHHQNNDVSASYYYSNN